MWPLERMILSVAVLGTIRTGVTRAFTTTTTSPVIQRRSLVGGLRALDEIGTPATSFDDGKRPYQITTPIYYVNDKPHIGHAYTSTGEFVPMSWFKGLKDPRLMISATLLSFRQPAT